jgi:hypothetical protein
VGEWVKEEEDQPLSPDTIRDLMPARTQVAKGYSHFTKTKFCAGVVLNNGVFRFRQLPKTTKV